MNFSFLIYFNNLTFTGEMLALETKQSGGKLLPHSVLRGVGVSRGSIAQKAKRDFSYVTEISTECQTENFM